jgi:hypothetical protein
MAGFDPDAYLAQKPAAAPAAFDPDAYLAAVAPVARKTAPEPQSFFGKVGSGLASLADTTVGGVLPMAGQVVQAASRPFTTPQRAEELGGMLSSALEKPFGKTFGVTETPAYKQESSRQLMDFIGANVNKGAEWIATKTGLPVEDVRNMVGSSMLAAPVVGKNALVKSIEVGTPVAKNALIAVKQTPVVQAVTDTLAQRAEAAAQQASAKDWARAPKIDASKSAQELGLVINPAESNPTLGTNLAVGAAGKSNVSIKNAKANMVRANEIAREDLGLPENTPLDSKAWNTALAKHDAPYQAVEKIPLMEPSSEVMGQLNNLKVDALSTSSPEKAAKINGVIDRVSLQVANGLSGKNVVGQSRDFRKEANRTLNNPNSTGIEVDIAQAQLGIAEALENLIENNISNPKALSEFRAARTGKAKVYDWERATGVTTKQVDPAQLVKLAENNRPLSGKLAQVAEVAGNFPKDFDTSRNYMKEAFQYLRRGGVGGTLGFAVGGPVGAAIGAGITSLGGEAAARLMARPGVQNRLAMPADRRIALPTTPVEPMAPIPQNRAVVPFDYSQQAFVPPNFTMVPNQYDARVRPAPSPIEIQRGLPAPSAEGTMGTLRAEDARRAQMSRTLGQQAEVQAAAAEAAARQPARGGQVLDIDPITGKLVAGAEGTRGMTPDIQIIESTGKSLSGAADLLASGKSPALMSAEQKIAWDKTKVDLADVVPGMKTLNDKAIAAKMQDRAWVQDAIVKAQDKARAFQDIAARAQTERLRQDALMKREQMLDLLETLEDQFSKARPVRTGGQGPKTRAFQRNMLTPEQEIQNALVK